tara:strand:+ start:4484 stop:5521 length:1038 start_codon:yes stop_codon:yes gene_type:complete
MEAYERDLIVYELFLGYKEYKVKEGLVLRIHNPSLQQLYKSQVVYKEAYRDALVKDNLTSEESVKLLKAEGIWSSEKEETLEQIPNEVEELKIKIFKNFRQTTVREGYRQDLRNLEDQFTELMQEKMQYNYVTCEGLATYAKLNWLIENTVTFEDGRPYDWKEVGINTVLNHVTKHMLSDSDARKISREEPWRSLWASSSKEGSSIFDRPIIELTQEQKSVVGWSKLYENVQESPDCPSKEIVEDDDAFDGWLIQENRKRDKDKKTKSLDDGLSDKVKNSDEIFIMADNQEEIEEIYDLNSEQSRFNIAQRQKAIKVASEKGKTAHDLDFMDVRTRIAQEQKGIR